MLQNAYFLAKIGADTAENEQHFAEFLSKLGNYPTGPPLLDAGCFAALRAHDPCRAGCFAALRAQDPCIAAVRRTTIRARTGRGTYVKIKYKIV